ncbi:hypothetical protein DL766_007672 [Monosporascus sp. MC13-8B]|nr:hypothetical protein DL763_005767 [Monosporascus cannonballus]RYP22618.1 hypothetical protein DL766_007672 [Monosporascus sp. MC13-8B]
MHGASSPQSDSGSGSGFAKVGVDFAKAAAKKKAKDAGLKAITTPIRTWQLWLRLGGRAVQLVFAVIVCAFYGNRVRRDSSEGNGQHPAWVFALFVGGVSCATAIIFALCNFAAFFTVPLRTHAAFAWDLLLSLFWFIVFGIFAAIFLRLDDAEEAAYEGARVGAMKVAVWLDLLNTFLWLLTGVYGFIYGYTKEKGLGFCRFWEKKATDKVSDVEANIHVKVNDRFGATLDGYNEKVNSNPVGKAVSGKVEAAIKSKVSAKVARMI